MSTTSPFEKCFKLRVKLPDGSTVFELSSKIESRNGTVLGYKDAYRHKVSGKEVKDRLRDRNSRFP